MLNVINEVLAMKGQKDAYDSDCCGSAFAFVGGLAVSAQGQKYTQKVPNGLSFS